METTPSAYGYESIGPKASPQYPGIIPQGATCPKRYPSRTYSFYECPSPTYLCAPNEEHSDENQTSVSQSCDKARFSGNNIKSRFGESPPVVTHSKEEACLAKETYSLSCTGTPLLQAVEFPLNRNILFPGDDNSLEINHTVEMRKGTTEQFVARKQYDTAYNEQGNLRTRIAAEATESKFNTEYNNLQSSHNHEHHDVLFEQKADDKYMKINILTKPSSSQKQSLSFSNHDDVIPEAVANDGVKNWLI